MVALPRLGRRRKGDRPHLAPQVSVVIPVYKVEQYLDECLISVLGQDVPLEVVVVDDGSPDASGRMAERWARRDRRVRVLHQANAGLGAARNAGLRAATAPYVTFCDSDDVVPEGAYQLLLASLEATGSDIVIGALERFDNTRTSMGPLMRRNHQVSRTRVTVHDEPLLLADVFSVNKMFSRSFWSRCELAFPEKVRYEDQPALTRALLAARSIDVLSDVVYRWRVREDGTSITQRRAELADLEDRVITKRDSTAVVTDAQDRRLEDTWFREILPVDMWEYFRAAPLAGEDYRRALRAAVLEFWNEATVPFAETLVPVQQRLMGWLVAEGRFGDLEQLIAFLDRDGVVTVERNGERLFAHPWCDEPGLPRGCVLL